MLQSRPITPDLDFCWRVQMGYVVGYDGDFPLNHKLKIFYLSQVKLIYIDGEVWPYLTKLTSKLVLETCVSCFSFSYSVRSLVFPGLFLLTEVVWTCKSSFQWNWQHCLLGSVSGQTACATPWCINALMSKRVETKCNICFNFLQCNSFKTLIKNFNRTANKHCEADLKSVLSAHDMHQNKCVCVWVIREWLIMS